MNENLSPSHLQYKIKEVLLKEWDPIGIQDIPEAQDEYDSYVSSIYKILTSKKSDSELFEYLWWIETEHMGLIGDRQHTLTIVNKLNQLGIEKNSAY